MNLVNTDADDPGDSEKEPKESLDDTFFEWGDWLNSPLWMCVWIL